MDSVTVGAMRLAFRACPASILLALLTACSSGTLDDVGTTTLSTYGSASQSMGTTSMTGEEMTTLSDTDDGSDPCGGASPCEDATADIPITGGVSNSLVPNTVIDVSTWGPAGQGGMSLTGTESNDSLMGAELGDTINGLGGNDALDGFVGDDLLYGGNGNDTIDGAEGNDHLEGGSGLDIIEGFGELDLIYGGGGDDRVYGGAGDDVLYGDEQVDELYGETDNDRMFGGDDGDTLDGDVGNDTLWGDGGDDTLLGQAGGDTLLGGPGNDTLGGGGDDDIYIWQADEGDDVIDGDDAGNEVLWIGGYAPADLSALRAGSDYILMTPTGSIRLVGYYSGVQSDRANPDRAAVEHDSNWATPAQEPDRWASRVGAMDARVSMCARTLARHRCG